LNDTRERSILFGIQSIRETENHLIFNTNLSDLMMMNKNTLELHRAIKKQIEMLNVVADSNPILVFYKEK